MAQHPHHKLKQSQVRSLGVGFHADGGGLYLNIDPRGGRGWILRTVVQGRRRDLGLGSASLVTLAEAREAARRLRKIARDGGDPRAVRDQNRRTSPTFEEATVHIFETRILPGSSRPDAAKQWLGRLRTHAFPVIGGKQLHTIASSDLLAVLEPVWLTQPETARRVRQRMVTIFDWAKVAGHINGTNPVEGIEAALPRQRTKTVHRAALPYAEVPAMWPRLEAAEGVAARALQFIILTAARSGEVCGMTWDEVDLEAGVWTVPAARSKMGKVHRVPLSPAALAVLEAVRGLHPARVFPGASGRRLAVQTVATALRSVGVAETVHGFRSTFRDWAEEMTTGFSREVKEAALAHAVKDAVERAYRRGDLFEMRRPLMAEWAAYATNGRAGA